VGEVASTGVHGANRLASNSLLEGLVFADRVARELVSEPVVPFAIPALRTPSTDDREPDDSSGPIRLAMRRVMTADVGVHRSEASLLRAAAELEALAQEVSRRAWRTRNQLLVARLITRAALERRESLGGHQRLDYPPIPRRTEHA
jgi:aspartate oxidase